MERGQLVQDVVPPLQAGMAEDLLAGHHLVGNAAEAQSDSDADSALVVLAGRRPAVGQRLEVVVAADQVVQNASDGGAELAVAVADQGTVGMVDFITLITRWTEAG